ncbi:hypothetical protein [Haloactinospora alba]|uniref:hypothetical protein n=1 Tax=Haloactinospora alba TaxID=405555 RepID=UPI00114EF95D|nr:hypothetical protein [Haloactinospora alba]
MEWSALIVLASVVLATLTFMLSPSVIKEPVGRALCQMFSVGGDESECDPEFRSDEYYEPERCMVSREGDGSTHTASVVLDGTSGTSFVREEFNDDSVRFTAIDQSALGGGVGIGVDAGGGPVQLEAEAGADAEYSNPQSASWDFDSTAEADKFEERIREKAKEDVSKFDFDNFESWADGGDLPEPDSVRSEHQVDIGAHGDAGLSIGNSGRGQNNSGNNNGSNDSGNGQDSGNSDNSGGDDNSGSSGQQDGETGDWQVNFDPGVDAAVGISGSMATETHADGSESSIYNLGGEASVGADWAVDEVTASKGRQGAMKVTRDEDGNITDITITQTTKSGTGDTEIITTQLPIEGEEQRQIAEEWLGAAPGGKALPITWDDMAPDELPEGADPFQELLFNEGNSSKATYDQSVTQEEIGLQVKLGVSLGYTYTSHSEDTEIKDAEYLGSPSEGEREYISYDDCVGE